MTDSKIVISQVQDLQLILHNIHAEDMSLCESFYVAALIEKLPQGWKEFKNYLKHKRKEMTLEELIVCLRIKEDNRNSEKRAGKHPMESKVNMVEHAPKAKKQKVFGEVHHKALNRGKLKSTSLMASVSSMTKRDIRPKIAIAKA